MILDWFNAEEAVSFARDVAKEISVIFPPEPQLKTSSTAKKNEKKLNSLVDRTQAFAQQKRLNIYKKAKFLNMIKWDMKEAGHKDEFINEIIALLAPLLR